MLRPLPASWTPETPTAASTGEAAEAAAQAVALDGKFFRAGPRRFCPAGFAYGPFAPRTPEGSPWPAPAEVERDFARMAASGATAARVYAVPPVWLLDAACSAGLRLLVDVPWSGNQVFTEDVGVRRQARQAVREATRAIGGHPAVFALSVANELRADIVRYAGPRRTERFLEELLETARGESPGCLLTFGNYPSTEYLRPRGVDFALVNVYLHDERAFADYLARLHALAGEIPLVLGEYGIDTRRETSEAGQAAQLEGHLRTAFAEGVAGAFLFCWSDNWHAHGWPMGEAWRFGVVGADGAAKPALAAVSRALADVPRTVPLAPAPKVSVIVCARDAEATLEACLRSLLRLDYPDYEIIVVDDGSTDATPRIIESFAPEVRTIRIDHAGLSHARNVGLEAAGGAIVAYTDADCEADENWLYYLVLALRRAGSGCVGAGGPNLIPDPDRDPVAACVALAPGGPAHVMLDSRTAEHVPGCNMAFLREAALAARGFDVRFRQAGDDVDFIWRLQDRGGRIVFAHAAQVWHHRRETVSAYLKQQRGYGRAEGMLRRKHPHRFNVVGAPSWRGGVYGPHGPALLGLRIGRDRIYHGAGGTALFQTIYRRPASATAALLVSFEWHVLAMLVALAGLVLWSKWALAAGLVAAAGMELVSIVLAIAAAMQQPAPRPPRWWTRPLIAYLHWRQPIARGWARYRGRWLMTDSPRETPRAAPPAPPRDPGHPGTLRFWSDAAADHGDGGADIRMALIRSLCAGAQSAGLRVKPCSGWSRWDVVLAAGQLAEACLVTAAEPHRDGRLLKLRTTARPTTTGYATAAIGLALALMVAWAFWPWGLAVALLPALLPVAALAASVRRVHLGAEALACDAAASAGLTALYKNGGRPSFGPR